MFVYLSFELISSIRKGVIMELMSIEKSERKAFKVTVRKHSIVCDMSLDDGGKDDGMSPTELFAAALGSCIGMIAFEYCKNHGFPSEGISLDIVPQLIDNPKRIQSIAIDLNMPEGFPKNRYKAIEHASKQCVIYNTLHNLPEIDMEIS